MSTPKRKPAAKRRPAARRPVRSARPFTGAVSWLLVGMGVYGVGIDARAATWPAAAAVAHLAHDLVVTDSPTPAPAGTTVAAAGSTR